ncbi:MAG: hypothetical protein IT318_15395 [Anaerolineales bacterium]|nr:hypothetical protein [Anaerolineales bacterium]
MDFVFTPYSLPVLLGGVGAAAIAFYGWGRRTRAGRLFAAFAFAGAVWAAAYFLEISSASLAAKLAWARIAYLGISLVPLAWLTFALQYTGRERSLRPDLLALGLAVPAVLLILVFTNHRHGLVWSDPRLDTSGPFTALASEPGVAVWVFAAYAHGVILLGISLVLLGAVRAPSLFHGQALVLLSHS